MALQKAIRQTDGVTTNYHRILFIQKTTNQRNSIVVISYVDGESRQEELLDASLQPYRKSVTYEMAYDPAMTIEMAYDYLKTLPQFEGAENI